ncbi:MAG: family 10 glycosylhydrolase [Marinilabiliales bacterium]|nr:family 10 glycosylhydrolase [Marinilabiliales bacterium]
MRFIYRIFLLILSIFMAFPSLGSHRQNELGYPTSLEPNSSDEPIKSEFRAVWIATINNIDWPSRPNLTVEQQKEEFLKLLDVFTRFNLNVVIFQVRAASDAFYASKEEPWSQFLTGKQGMAPTPFYDPLAWAIEACHQRGMELHAWFNPFRVRNIGRYPLAPTSFAAKHPQYVREYDKKLFLDPGYPEVRAHILKVIAEVAGKYPVDAILMDDYFYPYPVEGKKFGDERSFAKYGHNLYPKRIKEWRRNNINHLIKSVHDTLVQINPQIRFGISPFGIWRNKSIDPDGSMGKKGISSYDDLYADVRSWLRDGWIDYVIPQLYWEQGNHFGDFASLLKWWGDNSFGKPVYIGQALFKSTAAKNGFNQKDELNEQINLLRNDNRIKGFAFYSASNISKLNDDQIKSLCENQLSSAVVPHNDKVPHGQTNTQVQHPSPAPPKTPKPDKKALEKRFLLTFTYQPLSIRPTWDDESAHKPTLKKEKGYRLITWKEISDSTKQLAAFVGFSKTGDKRFRQNVLQINESGQFQISEKQWKEYKKMHFILVSTHLGTGKESYSGTFVLKRRHLKFIRNPFYHPS